MNTLDHTYPSQASLVVLHPHQRQSRRLIAHLLQRDGHTLIPVTLTADGIDAEALWRAIGIALQDWYNITLPPRPAEDLAAAKILAERLAALKPYMVIIDSYDRTDSDSAQSLMHTLIPYISEGCQIILEGRHLPLPLLTSAALRPHTTLYPLNEGRLMINYGVEGDGRHVLEVRANGRGRVFVNGREISSWDGDLPRISCGSRDDHP
ncbi:MAG TPA: hypothetical protein PLD47_05475 [Aggregatilineales bacterium]|nr:hypothetical protein [Anaerolineales bacterium]HRE47156.1 hypothetical protein [Aggregatilineales bacterium]